MSATQPLAIVGGARTPFMKAFTSMRQISAAQLGQVALTGALKASGLTVGDVDEVVFGNVAGPADTANIARVIALQSGVPQDRIAHTVNRNCASGMESILNGWQAIRSGRSSIVVAGGTESMSNIPMLVDPQAAAIWIRLAKAKTWVSRIKAITRFRPRHFRPQLGIELGLTDPVSGLNMGQTAEVLAREFAISRGDQDQYAMRSHHQAEAAQKRCFFSGEIAKSPSHDGTELDKDNGPRHGQSIPQLAKLRPLFAREGTVTAGNSCPLTDGAAALVLASQDHASKQDSPPLGWVTATAVAGCDPRRMGLGPVYATAKLIKQTGLTLDDFDLIELNEAFAAQVIACERAFASDLFARRELGRSSAIGEIPRDRLNLHGGAIALGHPVGTTGTRMVLTLLRALKEKGLRRGLATLCVGGGQGVAMVVETVLD